MCVCVCVCVCVGGCTCSMRWWWRVRLVLSSSLALSASASCSLKLFSCLHPKHTHTHTYTYTRTQAPLPTGELRLAVKTMWCIGQNKAVLIVAGAAHLTVRAGESLMQQQPWMDQSKELLLHQCRYFLCLAASHI